MSFEKPTIPLSVRKVDMITETTVNKPRSEESVSLLKNILSTKKTIS